MVRRLNIKLIVLFFIALWLFEKAGEVLGYLRNSTLAEQIRQAKGDTTALSGEELTIVRITDLVLASGVASLVGLLVGLFISLIICRKRKWHWLNPVLALLIVYLTGWLQSDKLNFVGHVLRMPGETFIGSWYYLINGFVSVFFGLLIFALINLMRHPDGNQRVTVKPQSA
jgi:hypothetical protein